MCANTTVANPRFAPKGIIVELNNNSKLIPVIASGLTIESLEVLINIDLVACFDFHKP